MTTYFISRHLGAHEWADAEGVVVDAWSWFIVKRRSFTALLAR